MRLDKYLQVSRLVKRRALANELCDAGRVSRNGRTARASADVAPGDMLVIRYGWRQLEVTVLDVPAGRVGKAEADTLYRVVADLHLGPSPEATAGDEDK